jgi:hypothetical protein
MLDTALDDAHDVCPAVHEKSGNAHRENPNCFFALVRVQDGWRNHAVQTA